MLDTEFHISTLIAAQIQGTITDAQRAELAVWLDQDPKHRLHLEETYREQVLNEKLKRYERADREAIWAKTITKIQANNVEQGTATVRMLYPYKRKLAIVAAVAAVVCAAVLFFYNDAIRPSQNVHKGYQNDVAPGAQGATLTLTNGKQIKLSDATTGQLAEEAGVRITKSADGELIYEISGSDKKLNSVNTLSTAKGQTYRLRLPDGSAVWLNAGSTLTYSANLNRSYDGKRYVMLVGEAYFEIAENKARPFVVQSGTQEIEVLGTQFNVNAYADEPAITTTLMEGAIKVTDGRRQRILKPGQQVANANGNLQLATIEVDNVIDWKDGDFYLNHVNFKTAMRKIARWYDVEVVYDASIPDDMEAGGWISRDKPLSQVLKSIESSGMVRFRIEGKKIHVIK
ncbi:DUF4974 domain-containing protein [Sphingobacterium alkalisoli]|uniref:DUF4974 domain-containing protein n=1 Tax=Sphingobacterium alkalisoli TaxID=1874115 RepID=A0A4U0GRB4_9SPHI|nr:FecR family protein [Sphingobacterium alkalisoli]TJY61485.1 DUF4974 domain-containing protein [Sphingobacterium alkalisoli]GGH30100.1 iron dicitrate transporter FecR [Sphingobacterium alkalisoli]